MYLAIYKDLDKKITRYYYIKDDKLYYDEYSGFRVKKVRVKSLDDFFNLFKNTKDSLLIKNEGSYYVYFDSDYYKRYVKEGKEDFIKFFEENGVDALFYLADINIKSAVKQFLFKTSTATISLIASAGLFSILNNPKLLNFENLNDEIVSEEEINFNDEDFLLALNKNSSSLTFDRIIPMVNSEIIPDILKYYDNTEKSTLYSVKLDNMKVIYYSEEEGPDTLGYYNLTSPNIIHIREDMKNVDEFDIFAHEFIHLLQFSGTHNYLDEPVAELMSSEYFGLETNHYLDEVINLKLLIRTIGREPILKHSFGGDDSELFEILENNLDANTCEKMKDMLSTRHREYEDHSNDFNMELRALIEKLYFNINGVEMNKLPDYNLLTSNHDTVSNRSILTVEYKGLPVQSIGPINKTDDRMFLKKSDEYTISYEVPYHDEVPEGAEKIDYFKKQVSFDEYELIKSNPGVMTLTEYKEFVGTNFVNGIEYYEFVVDGKNTLMELQTAIDKGFIKFYVINTEDQLDSLDGYTYALSRLRIKENVDPILGRYDEVKTTEVVSSNNISK